MKARTLGKVGSLKHIRGGGEIISKGSEALCLGATFHKHPEYIMEKKGKVNVVGVWNYLPHAQRPTISSEGDCPTLQARLQGDSAYVAQRKKTDMRNERLKQIANIYNIDDNSARGRVYDNSHESPSLTTPTGGSSQPKVVSYDTQNKRERRDGMTGTLMTDGSSPNKNPRVSQDNGLRIRKLTPRECWRLMGVKDEDFDKVEPLFSDSTLYHLAGDSIVVPVLMAIFGEMDGRSFPKEFEKFKKEWKEGGK